MKLSGAFISQVRNGCSEDQKLKKKIYELNAQRAYFFKGYPVNITTKQWEVIFAKRDDLIQEFQWKVELKQTANDKLQELRTKYNTSIVVAVHARRTDYSTYLQAYYGSFRPANASYYTKAMDYFR